MSPLWVRRLDEPHGAGLNRREWAVVYGEVGLTVCTFATRADAEYWLALHNAQTRPGQPAIEVGGGCGCVLPEQSCAACRKAAARNEAHAKGGDTPS